MAITFHYRYVRSYALTQIQAIWSKFTAAEYVSFICEHPVSVYPSLCGPWIF